MASIESLLTQDGLFSSTTLIPPFVLHSQRQKRSSSSLVSGSGCARWRDGEMPSLLASEALSEKWVWHNSLLLFLGTGIALYHNQCSEASTDDQSNAPVTCLPVTARSREILCQVWHSLLAFQLDRHLNCCALPMDHQPMFNNVRVS
jgi:hypothetical protein